jgi:hypothetical protein
MPRLRAKRDHLRARAFAAIDDFLDRKAPRS